MSKKKSSSSSDRLRLDAVVVDLPLLDSLELDALAIGVFTEDRPLKGTAGFCDWRLNGRLSAILRAGHFGGQPGETLLTDTNGRIAPVRMLLFGLGSRAGLEASAVRQAVRTMLVVAKKAKYDRLGLEPPGLALGLMPVDELVRTTLEVVHKAHPRARLTLLCPDKAALDAAAKVAKADTRVEWIVPT